MLDAVGQVAKTAWPAGTREPWLRGQQAKAMAFIEPGAGQPRLQALEAKERLSAWKAGREQRK